MGTSKTYTLDQYRDEREAQLARQKNAAIQNQNVSFEKLQKYLAPSEATARSGYSQGLSETALIAADNSRQRAIASAENDYNIAHTELMNKYRVEKKAEEDKLKAEADAERDERFGSIYSHVVSGEWDTVDNLKAYIDANSEGLTDFQKGQLQSKLDYYTSNPDKKPGAAQDKAEADAERDERYNNILSIIESGKWSTVEELEALIKENSTGFTAIQNGVLQHMLSYYKSNPDKKPGAMEDKIEDERVEDNENLERDNRYNSVISTMDAGDFTSVAALEAYIKENSKDFTEFQKSTINNKLSVIKSDPYWQKVEDSKQGIYSLDTDDVNGIDESVLPTTDEQWKSAENKQKGDDFTITIGENDYDVELGEGIDLPGDFLKKVDNGGLIVVSGKLHIRYGDRFYLVVDRNGSTSSYDYKQLMKIVKTVQ